jgi:hypothetical protein
MDPALHVRRGHGQRCVYSARGVGTVCVRCVAEVLALPTQTRTDPASQRDHSSALGLATTRARYAKALVELVRDAGAVPDVADAWGHVLVAASIDAIVADDTYDNEGVTPACVESVARLVTTAARVDGGELLDAAVDRVLTHLVDWPVDPQGAAQGRERPSTREAGLPFGVLGLPPVPVVAATQRPYQVHLPNSQPQWNDSQVSLEDSQRLGLDAPRDAGGTREHNRDNLSAYRDSQSTTSHAFPNRLTRESQNSVGAAMAHPGLARRQPRFPARHEAVQVPGDNFVLARDPPEPPRGATPRLLRVLATLLQLDCVRDDLPNAFKIPAPAQGNAPPPGIAVLVEHLLGSSVSQNQKAPQNNQNQLRRVASPARVRTVCTELMTTEISLAALDATAAFVAKADGGNALALASLREDNSSSATALALGAASAGWAAAVDLRGNGSARFSPNKNLVPSDHLNEDSLLLALRVIDALARRVGVDLDAMTCPGAMTAPGVINSSSNGDARASPVAETLKRGMLCSSVATRAAACVCVSSLVQGGQNPAAVGRLVTDDVLEHVFEVLREVSRDSAGVRQQGTERRTVGHGQAQANSHNSLNANRFDSSRADSDAARFAALNAFRSLLTACPASDIAQRLVFGIDVLRVTIDMGVMSRDIDVLLTAVAVAEAVGEFGDPGNIPATAVGRLCDSVLEVYETVFLGTTHMNPHQGVRSGSGSNRGGDDHQPNDASNHSSGSDTTGDIRKRACAALVAFLSWRSLSDAGVGGEAGGTAPVSTRARRAFILLARDVSRNLSLFGTQLIGDGNGPGAARSPYSAPGTEPTFSFEKCWDLPRGAAAAMRLVLSEHFDLTDVSVAERVLREQNVHHALAVALRGLAFVAEESRRRRSAIDTSPIADQLAAVAETIGTYGVLLGGAVEETPRDVFFPSEENDVDMDGLDDVDGMHDSGVQQDCRATRTRLARDLVRQGVLSASLIAAAADVFPCSQNETPPGHFGPNSEPNFGGFENSQSTDDDRGGRDNTWNSRQNTPTGPAENLLGNFIGVLLSALDDPGVDQHGFDVLAGVDEERYVLGVSQILTHCFISQLVTVQTDYPDCCPYIVQYTPNTGLTLFFSKKSGGKTFTCFDLFPEPGVFPSAAALACVFAHVKYGGTAAVVTEDDFLLTRFAPALRNFLRNEVPNGDELFLESASAYPTARAVGTDFGNRNRNRPSADDPTVHALVVSLVSVGKNCLVIKTLPEFVVQTITRRVLRRASVADDGNSEGDAMSMQVALIGDGSLSPPSASPSHEDLAFASFTELVCGGSGIGNDLVRCLADCTRFGDDAGVTRGVTHVLLRGVAFPSMRQWLRDEAGGRESAHKSIPHKTVPPGVTEHPNGTFPPQINCDPKKFLETLAGCPSAIALLVLRVVGGSGSCFREQDVFLQTERRGDESFGGDSSRKVTSDAQKSDARDAALFALRKRPTSTAAHEAASELWPYVMQRVVDITDSTYDVHETELITSRMEIAQATALVVFDAESGVGRTPGETREESAPRTAFFFPFITRCAHLLRTSLSPRERATSSLTARLSMQNVARAATATMRALTAVTAVATRGEIETDGRVELEQRCVLSAAAAARRALLEWHGEVKTQELEVTSQAQGVSAACDPVEDSVRRAAVRDARRAAMVLLSITAVASRTRVELDAAEDDTFALVEVLADVAQDGEDGVFALDALAAISLSGDNNSKVTPDGKIPGTSSGKEPLQGTTHEKATALVVQAGRVALCVGENDDVRDAGALCLWAALGRDLSTVDECFVAPDGDGKGGPGSLAVSLPANARTVPLVDTQTKRNTDDTSGNSNNFDSVSGNWEASLLEDWLAASFAPTENTEPPKAKSERFSQTEGRLRLAATLARVAPDAFRRHVLRSCDATTRLIQHAMCALPSDGRGRNRAGKQLELCSPGAVAALCEILGGPGSSAIVNRLPTHELRGVRTALVEARQVTGTYARRFVSIAGASGTENTKGCSLADGVAFATRARLGFGNSLATFAASHPRFFPRKESDTLSTLDSLIATLDDEVRKRPGSPHKGR